MKQHPHFLKAALCLMLLLCAAVTFQAYARSTTPTPLPSRGAMDIGSVGHAGAFIENGNTDRIWASGNDIWGQRDQFHYVWYDLPGNGQMVTRVLSQDATDGRAKAGIMLRETTADNAVNVFLAQTPQYGVMFQERASTDAQTTNLSSPQITTSTWLKLVRHATTITGFVSANGTVWTTVGSVTLAMGATSIIGLAVTAHNNQMRSRAVFANVALTRGLPLPALTAARVYGQNGSFTSNIVNNGIISADSLYNTSGAAVDKRGNLYVADNYNNRVLFYPAGSTTATRVYGQGSSFTSNSVGGGPGFYHPQGLAVDSGGNLYVVDSGNQRVLFYPAGSTTATRVYGQAGSFTSTTNNNSGVSANSLSNPIQVAVDSSNNVYIADNGNQRVLFYPAGITTATRVYGQGGSFTSTTPNNGGISANSFASPTGVAVDNDGNLYVADSGNNRMLYYPAGSTTATRVYGQGDSFTSGTANTGGVSANSLNSPAGAAIDDSNDVYITDYGNNRVLYYPAGSTTATQVYGQGGSLTSNSAGTSATSLNAPYGEPAVDSDGNLYVTDSGNNRTLMFPSS